MAGTVAFEILSHKIMNRVINDSTSSVSLQVKPPTDDDVDVLGSILLHGHVGCFFPAAFFYASLKLLFPSYNLEGRVVRQVKKSKSHSDIKWRTASAANKISSVCHDFHQALFGEYPACKSCIPKEHFPALRMFWLKQRKKAESKAEKEILDIYLLKLKAYENLDKGKLNRATANLLELSRLLRSRGGGKGSRFYEALSMRYLAFISSSSQEAREYLLKESRMLKGIGLGVEASRALADYFRLLAEVEPSSYRSALYYFFAYALRKREVFGCIAYAWDLFEYHKHLACHYAILEDNALALKHADKAEELARDFNMKDEIEEIRSLSSLLRGKGNVKSSLRRLRSHQIYGKYLGELSDTASYYVALKTSDFRIKSQILHRISKNLLNHGENEVGRYYSFLAEICDYVPLSKARRRQDILKLKGIAAKYRFENLAGAEIHKELLEVLLRLSEAPDSFTESDLKEIERKLTTINDQCKSLLNDELMLNVVEVTSSIVSELRRYLSLSRSESIKIADVAYQLIRMYEDRVPGLLKYMEYPELVELLYEGTTMFKSLLVDLSSPLAAQRLQGKVSYTKGLSLEQDLCSALVRGLWKNITPLKQFKTASARLRDREGTREKDLVLHLKSDKEEAMAIFTVKNQKRPCGIGLVDEFKTVIEEEKRLQRKEVLGFFIARAFSSNAVRRCESYGMIHYTIKELQDLAKELP